MRTGFCECGCGEPTRVARQTRNDRGDVKGQPVRFATGHNTRTSPVEYLVAETGCWEWQRAKDPSGYGRMRSDGSTRLAHRVFYERANGPIPEGLPLDHLCRNPSCVNPDHLEPVTPAVNIQRGVGTKLDPDRVRQIRALAGKVTRIELARRFGIGTTALEKVIQRRSWRNVA